MQRTRPQANLTAFPELAWGPPSFTTILDVDNGVQIPQSDCADVRSLSEYDLKELYHEHRAALSIASQGLHHPLNPGPNSSTLHPVSPHRAMPLLQSHVEDARSNANEIEWGMITWSSHTSNTPQIEQSTGFIMAAIGSIPTYPEDSPPLVLLRNLRDRVTLDEGFSRQWQSFGILWGWVVYIDQRPWKRQNLMEPALGPEDWVAFRNLVQDGPNVSRLDIFFDRDLHQCKWIIGTGRCSYTTKRMDMARCHLRIHLEYFPFVCKGDAIDGCGEIECEEKYPCPRRLAEHIKRRKERTKACGFCGTFITRQNLAEHKRSACPQRPQAARSVNYSMDMDLV